AALDDVVKDSPAKLGDVSQRRGAGEGPGGRLPPHEHPPWPRAQGVFAGPRGGKGGPAVPPPGERALASGGGAAAAARLLSNAPGMLWRSLDRLLRQAGDLDAIVGAATETAPQVSGRVLLSVREHLVNRQRPTDESRVFAGRQGR